MIGFFIVDCTPGADGGLPQRFHCEVYQLSTNQSNKFKNILKTMSLIVNRTTATSVDGKEKAPRTNKI